MFVCAPHPRESCWSITTAAVMNINQAFKTYLCQESVYNLYRKMRREPGKLAGEQKFLQTLNAVMLISSNFAFVAKYGTKARNALCVGIPGCWKTPARESRLARMRTIVGFVFPESCKLL